MNKLLDLSEGIYLFSPESVNRIEPVTNPDGSKPIYQTVLYHNEKKITTVKNSLDEIKAMLYNEYTSLSKESKEKV